MSDHVLHCPPGYSSADLFARGNSGFLYSKPHGCRVVKYPPSYAFADLRNEYNIYTRLAENGGSDRITQCFGIAERGIELEFLEGGCLTSVLKGLQYDDEDLEKRLLWVCQGIEAIRHAHSKNIHDYDHKLGPCELHYRPVTENYSRRFAVSYITERESERMILLVYREEDGPSISNAISARITLRHGPWKNMPHRQLAARGIVYKTVGTG